MSFRRPPTTLPELIADIEERLRREQTLVRTPLLGVIPSHSRLLDLGHDDHQQYVLRSILTALGSLLVRDSDGAVSEVLVGPDGTVLSADSSSPKGVSWQSTAILRGPAGSTGPPGADGEDGEEGPMGPPGPSLTGSVIQIPYQVGQLYGPRFTGYTNTAVPSGVETVTPFYVTSTITIDKLAIQVIGQGSTGNYVTRLGIYKNKSPAVFYPGALLIDAGTDPAETNSVSGIVLVTASAQMTPGLYWFVTKHTGTTFNSQTTVYSSKHVVFPLAVAAAFGNDIVAFRRTGVAAGAFSDPYPAAVAVPTADSGDTIAVAYRIASVDA